MGTLPSMNNILALLCGTCALPTNATARRRVVTDARSRLEARGRDESCLSLVLAPPFRSNGALNKRQFLRPVRGGGAAALCGVYTPFSLLLLLLLLLSAS